MVRTMSPGRPGVGGRITGEGPILQDRITQGLGTTTKRPPFMLGEGIPPVPARLVARIWKGEYIDMADLLRDNLEADRRRSTPLGTPQLHPQSKPLRREVPDILSWALCFGVYIGVVAEQIPQRVKQLLAYQATVLREARRCGGTGWRGYDSMFRQLAATDESIDWSCLNPSLYVTTFRAQQGGGGKMCHLCMGTDHTQEDCALAPLLSKKLKGPAPEVKDERSGGPPVSSQLMRDPRARRRSEQTCYAWNEGRCHYCRYRHVCLHCRGDHRSLNCTRQLSPVSPVPPHGTALGMRAAAAPGPHVMAVTAMVTGTQEL